ncbi:MAG TPA: CopG family transcriptional regulator [Bacillota bacterium]|jgi:CopG family transcriptional regulator/antitoxin EndoAI
MAKAIKITITLTDDLIAILDGLKKREKTTRSGAIASLLRRARQRQVEADMAEGYLAMTDKSRENAESTLPAQAEVALRHDP